MTPNEIRALNPGERISGYGRFYTVIESARPVADGGFSLVAIERGQTKRQRLYFGIEVVDPDKLSHGWPE